MIARDSKPEGSGIAHASRLQAFFHGRGHLSWWSTLLLCALGIIVNVAIFDTRVISGIYTEHSDFRQLYTGAMLLRHGGLYDPDAYLSLQNREFGGLYPGLPPNRLPFYYLLLSPLTRFSFETAQSIWLIITVLASGGFILLCAGASRARAAVACCWSWPLLLSFALGQDISLMLLLGGAALRLIYRERSWWVAGFLLSLCWIKFNLILLLPLLILVRRKWRLAAGFASGTAALMIISFLAAGWKWPLRYVPFVLSAAGSPGVNVMPNLHGLIFHLKLPVAVEALGSLAVAAMVYWVIRRSPFSVAVAATLLGSLLVSWHAYFQDCALLVPSLWALVRPANSDTIRICAWILLIPTLYRTGFVQGSGFALATVFVILLVLLTLNASRRGRQARAAE